MRTKNKVIIAAAFSAAFFAARASYSKGDIQLYPSTARLLIDEVPMRSVDTSVRHDGSTLAFWDMSTNDVQKLSFRAGQNELNVDNYSQGLDGLSLDSSVQYSASYEILYVAARTEYEFYVLGQADSGDYVIERWKPKAFFVGSPLPGGGGSSAGDVPLKRKELYRGTSLGDVQSLGVDPLGAFLFVLHGDTTTLSRFDISTKTIDVIYDTSDVLELELHGRPGINPRLHSTEGMIWSIEGWHGQTTDTSVGLGIVFHDDEGDGYLDAVQVFSDDHYHDTYGLNVPIGTWQDLFLD